MNTSGNDSSPDKATGFKTSSLSQASSHWDLGPELKPPGELQSLKSIKAYIFQHHRNQIFIMVLALIMLLVGIYCWDELRLPIQIHNATTVPSESPASWADWLIRLQSFLNIPILLVALFVWYSEIREDWGNDLPKLMSVFFFYEDNPTIVCRHVWLAGADDLRAWGQQVAAQAACERFLDFSPDLEAKAPSLVIGTDGIVYRHYALRFKLTTPPHSLITGMCCYQNVAGVDKSAHSIPLERVKALQVITNW